MGALVPANPGRTVRIGLRTAGLVRIDFDSSPCLSGARAESRACRGRASVASFTQEIAMNMERIINEAADEADEVLNGIRVAKEARPVIQEWISERHPELSGTDRTKVAAGVIAILQREGFFDVSERRTGMFGGEDANELAE
jgi:hypothetical protein